MQGFLVSWVQSWGYAAIFVLGVLEAACIPISSEVTFLLGGALASGGLSATHHLNLALVIVVGTLGEMTGSYLSYGVGRAGGRPLVRRWGRYVLVTEGDIARAERFLVGRGIWAVPAARILPFVRTFASIVGGIVDVPAVRFGVLSLIGTVIYVIILSSAGYAMGTEWTKFSKDFSDASYVLVVLLVIALTVVVVHRVREFRKEPGPGSGGYGYAAKHGGTPQRVRPNPESGRDPRRDPRRDPGRDPRRDPGLDPRRDPGRDPRRDPRRDTRRDPGREWMGR